MADFERLSADWLAYDEALARVLAAASPLPAERVPVGDALGRVLAVPVSARATLPAWRNSAMDGYAVRSQEFAGGAAGAAGTAQLLPVAGVAYPGSVPLAGVPAGRAVRIMTGGPLPEGFDSVIRVEHTDGERTRPGLVSIRETTDLGRHVRPAGEDMRAGEEAARAGTVVRSGSLAVLLASGCEEVAVFGRPRVGVLSSGDELAGPGRFDQVVAGTAVPDSNRGMIAAAVEEVGGIAVDLGVVRDDAASLAEKLFAYERIDVLVATGGASMGERDLLKRVMLEHGFRLGFWRVRMRPGSPVAFGRLPAGRAGERELPVFSLPGNPASAFVTFHALVAPFLRAAAGSARPAGLSITATTDTEMTAPKGIAQFYRVRIAPGSGPADLPRCSLSGPQGSGLVRSLRDADGLAVLPPGTSRVAPEDPVSVLLLPGFA